MSKYHIRNITFIALYVSLVLGFFYNEDLNGGAKGDFLAYLNIIKDLNNDFLDAFLNYERYGDRHSPLSSILLSQLFNFNLTEFSIRFINLNISIAIIFFFYKCLKIVFNDVDKYFLQLLALVIFLSPTFRSLSIWPDSRIHGLLFFLISLLYFLKFIHEEKNSKYIFLNSLFLVISSYFSPNFSVFSIYFFWNYFTYYKFDKIIFYYFLFNLILSIPMIYYLFYLDVFFLASGVTPNSEDYKYLSLENLSNKFLLISSMIFFYLIPLIYYDKRNFFDFQKIKLKDLFIIIISTCILIYFFNYKVEFTGGGIFFKISNVIFGNNLFFYLVSVISIYVIFKKYYTLNNTVIFLILVISNPQLTIYHKYYDPLLIILFFTIFNLKINKDYFKNHNLIILYLFYSFFIFLNIIKNFI